MTTNEDIDLLYALKQGDEQAFNKLFKIYWEKVYAVAYHRLGDEQDADDLVQELFISLWERREGLSIKGSLENYLMGAVKFKVISRLRNRSVKEKVFEDLRHRMTEVQEAEADAIDFRELDKTLTDALSSLNDNVRTAFVMRSDNMSIKEIALQMGLKEQTVRNYIADAIQRIRIIIKQKHADNPAFCLALTLSFVHNYLT